MMYAPNNFYSNKLTKQCNWSKQIPGVYLKYFQMCENICNLISVSMHGKLACICHSKSVRVALHILVTRSICPCHVMSVNTSSLLARVRCHRSDSQSGFQDKSQQL